MTASPLSLTPSFEDDTETKELPAPEPNKTKTITKRNESVSEQKEALQENVASSAKEKTSGTLSSH